MSGKWKRYQIPGLIASAHHPQCTEPHVDHLECILTGKWEVRQDHKRGCPTCGCTLYQETGPCAGVELLEALRPIAAAYSDDPGTSDLYDDQPVTIHLGDVRRAWAAIRKAEGK